MTAAFAADWPGRTTVIEAIEAAASALRLDAEVEDMALALATAALAPVVASPLTPQQTRLLAVLRAAGGRPVPRLVLDQLGDMGAAQTGRHAPVVLVAAARRVPAVHELVGNRFGFGLFWRQP